MPELEIRSTYLFSLMEFSGTDPCLMNPEQGVIKIDEINKASVKDEYGYISVKDMISYFGYEKLADFEAGNFPETEWVSYRWAINCLLQFLNNFF